MTCRLDFSGRHVGQAGGQMEVPHHAQRADEAPRLLVRDCDKNDDDDRLLARSFCVMQV